MRQRVLPVTAGELQALAISSAGALVEKLSVDPAQLAPVACCNATLATGPTLNPDCSRVNSVDLKNRLGDVETDRRAKFGKLTPVNAS
jgi:hypothetical protein